MYLGIAAHYTIFSTIYSTISGPRNEQYNNIVVPT